MSNVVVRWVSFALARLDLSGGTISITELRRFMEAKFGSAAVAISDAEIRDALLELQDGATRVSAPITDCDTSVTCTPLPDGWIPLDQFRRNR